MSLAKNGVGRYEYSYTKLFILTIYLHLDEV